MRVRCDQPYLSPRFGQPPFLHHCKAQSPTGPSHPMPAGPCSSLKDRSAALLWNMDSNK